MSDLVLPENIVPTPAPPSAADLNDIDWCRRNFLSRTSWLFFTLFYLMAFRSRSRGYSRRYRRRRASGRVVTANGRTARFVKAPSYKNMAYKGNERAGVLHEIKFVR